MAIFPSPIAKSPSWPVALGAESIAAAQFARCGFDVLVQSGRDKPWYDLVVTKAGNLLKVSVKASENGQWELASGYMRKVAEKHVMRNDAKSAIDAWRAGYGLRTVCCLVQFEGVALHQMPRVYLASPDEIATAMRETAERTGRCALAELYEWTAEDGTRMVETLPDRWQFSQDRVRELLGQGNGVPIPVSAPRPVAVKTPAAAARVAAESVGELVPVTV